MTASSKKAAADALALRITVVDPPPNISWALQLGRDELVEPAASTKARISFDFSVEVVAGDSPGEFRLRGPAVQGQSGGHHSRTPGCGKREAVRSVGSAVRGHRA